MDVSGLFGIGGSWVNAFRAAYVSIRDTFAPKRSTGSRTAPHVSAPKINVLTESIRSAGGALRTALSAFATETRPVYTTTLYTGL